MTRATYAALVAATIVVGLLVHRGAVPLGAEVRDVMGDALWASMIYWGTGVLAPTARPGMRAAVAVACCWAVELSQLVHTPALDAVRATSVGHLVLGSDWDARDLVAYAAGVAVAALVERAAAARKRAVA